ncbi:hypothetical protein [Bacillus cereus]|uniref:hypothetical protein n=1 Tax=Bacillus cereus TaxID=1396 RepID=UPI000B4C1589|nr:hypothetical protein [Bacillus cereus]
MQNIKENLFIKTTQVNMKTPMRSTIGSAGYDVFAHKDILLPSNKIISLELPFTFYGDLEQDVQIRLFDRSSYGIKKDVRLVYKEDKNIEYLTIDLSKENYVIDLINEGPEDLLIRKGEHFAQFIISDSQPEICKTVIEDVPFTEAEKHNIMPSKIIEVQPNVYDYIIQEPITLKANEKRIFATGLRCLIDEGTWTSITTHKDCKDKVMLANQNGVIDRDYAYTDNFGHCFVALINLKNEEITLPIGTNLLKWKTERYYTLSDEVKSNRVRTGGVGSTSKDKKEN